MASVPSLTDAVLACQAARLRHLILDGSREYYGLGIGQVFVGRRKVAQVHDRGTLEFFDLEMERQVVAIADRIEQC